MKKAMRGNPFPSPYPGSGLFQHLSPAQSPLPLVWSHIMLCPCQSLGQDVGSMEHLPPGPVSCPVASRGSKPGCFCRNLVACLASIFQGVLHLGWGYLFYFPCLLPPSSGWSFSAGRCLHKSGFAEGCADIYASVLL